MGLLGTLAFMLAIAGAGWLLWRNASGQALSGRNMTLLKGVLWLGFAAVLFLAKLWPLALMMLLATGGVTAIETWRERAIKQSDAAAGGAMTPKKAALSKSEAAAVLGVAEDADADTVKSAHKKLISQLHPDKGGTDYLAAKINEAREAMLRA